MRKVLFPALGLALLLVVVACKQQSSGDSMSATPATMPSSMNMSGDNSMNSSPPATMPAMK